MRNKDRNPLTEQIHSAAAVLVDLNHTLDVAISTRADYQEIHNLEIAIKVLYNYRDDLVALDKGYFSSMRD